MPRSPITKADIRSQSKENERGCWVWQGSEITGSGYPYWGRWGTLVHREAYKLWIGDIPKDEEGKTLQLEHRCSNKLCVNPYHRYPVTRSMNVMLAYIEKHKQMPWKHLRVARAMHNAVGNPSLYARARDAGL